jgi:glycerol-3-phosphate acyltransferase PlsX
MAKDFNKLRREVVVRRRTRIRPHHAVTIALDAMGTEAGPDEALIGAFAAVESLPHVTVICTGDKKRLQAGIDQHGLYNRRLQIEHASEVVGMHEKPHDSLRKQDSSVIVAARLVHDKRAGGMISPGNTGATMAACMVTWRRLPGISRPAIAAVLPHPLRPCLLLDVGANVDCKARNLLHFAFMGSVYSRFVLHRRNPRIGLLSNGEEESKGNEVVREAHELLRGSTLNFRGNAEGRDLMNGSFDVVVCDGFVGNTILKFGEGLSEFIMTNLKEEVQRNMVSQLGALAMLPALKKFKKQVDHTEYGGAPLLGLNGTCVICHGSSRAKAIMNAIRVAADLVASRVNEHVLEVLQANPLPET